MGICGYMGICGGYMGICGGCDGTWGYDEGVWDCLAVCEGFVGSDGYVGMIWRVCGGMSSGEHQGYVGLDVDDACEWYGP